MKNFKNLMQVLTKRHKLQKYCIGNIEIALSPAHALPAYQSSFRLYDRFPLCVGQVAVEGWVVDIGANVGDSAAAFVSGPPKNLLCIEPHKPFLDILKKNKAALESAGSRIVIESAAVARTIGTVCLDASASTAKVSTNTLNTSALSEAVASEPLDRIVRRVCGDEAVAFIKCDVDGFDAEALLSGTKTLSRWRPALYFECDTNLGQIDGYLELFRLLRSMGYQLKTFDNFGMPLLDVESERIFEQLLIYTASLKAERSQQTIYYVDCFAFDPGSPTAAEILRYYNDLVGVG